VVGFLIDMSNNTRVHWKTYQDAILELVWNLLPGDKRYTGYLITYSNGRRVGGQHHVGFGQESPTRSRS